MRPSSSAPRPVKALRVQHLVVTEDDLRNFLGGQPPGGVSVRLGDGAADMQVVRLGPVLSARVRPLSGTAGSPFTLVADRVKIGRLPHPTFWSIGSSDSSTRPWPCAGSRSR